MKNIDNMIEYRKRRIRSGQRARTYGSLFYIISMIILFLIEEVELYPLILFLVFIYFLMIGLMTARLNIEKSKLDKLLDLEVDK